MKINSRLNARGNRSKNIFRKFGLCSHGCGRSTVSSFSSDFCSDLSDFLSFAEENACRRIETLRDNNCSSSYNLFKGRQKEYLNYKNQHKTSSVLSKNFHQSRMSLVDYRYKSLLVRKNLDYRDSDDDDDGNIYSREGNIDEPDSLNISSYYTNNSFFRPIFSLGPYSKISMWNQPEWWKEVRHSNGITSSYNFFQNDENTSSDCGSYQHECVNLSMPDKAHSHQVKAMIHKPQTMNNNFYQFVPTQIRSKLSSSVLNNSIDSLNFSEYHFSSDNSNSNRTNLSLRSYKVKVYPSAEFNEINNLCDDDEKLAILKKDISEENENKLFENKYNSGAHEGTSYMFPEDAISPTTDLDFVTHGSDIESSSFNCADKDFEEQEQVSLVNFNSYRDMVRHNSQRQYSSNCHRNSEDSNSSIRFTDELQYESSSVPLNVDNSPENDSTDPPLHNGIEMGNFNEFEVSSSSSINEDFISGNISRNEEASPVSNLSFSNPSITTPRFTMRVQIHSQNFRRSFFPLNSSETCISTPSEQIEENSLSSYRQHWYHYDPRIMSDDSDQQQNFFPVINNSENEILISSMIRPPSYSDIDTQLELANLFQNPNPDTPPPPYSEFDDLGISDSPPSYQSQSSDDECSILTESSENYEESIFTDNLSYISSSSSTDYSIFDMPTTQTSSMNRDNFAPEFVSNLFNQSNTANMNYTSTSTQTPDRSIFGLTRALRLNTGQPNYHWSENCL